MERFKNEYEDFTSDKALIAVFDKDISTLTDIINASESHSVQIRALTLKLRFLKDRHTLIKKVENDERLIRLRQEQRERWRQEDEQQKQLREERKAALKEEREATRQAQTVGEEGPEIS